MSTKTAISHCVHCIQTSRLLFGKVDEQIRFPNNECLCRTRQYRQSWTTVTMMGDFNVDLLKDRADKLSWMTTVTMMGDFNVDLLKDSADKQSLNDNS